MDYKQNIRHTYKLEELICDTQNDSKRVNDQVCCPLQPPIPPHHLPPPLPLPYWSPCARTSPGIGGGG